MPMIQTSMKLQHKAWALVLAIVGLASLGAMFGARHIVTDSFGQLETERASREGERARRLLHQQLMGLSSTVKDYAQWVEAVRFVQGRAPAFMDENFDESNMGYLRISEVMVFDKKGALKASLTLNADGVLGTVPADRASRYFESVAPVVADASAQTTLQTYQAAAGQLEMLAAAPIRDPDKPGDSPHGAILMVRHFDDVERQRFSEVLMVPVSLSFDAPDHHGTPRAHLVPAEDDRDVLHAVVQDADGRAVVELVLRLDRDLQRVGNTLAWNGMGLAVAGGLLASVLLVVLLDRLILRRLQRLLGEVQDITERGPAAAGQVAVEGDDELSRLGEGVNQLLARVRSDTQHQHDAHERQEALQIQLMQSQKTEALGRLTGGIAHDFNNSLAAITGWVRLAAEDVDLDHPSQEALQQALKAARYADGLMRQLLAFGRQSAPKLRRLHWTSLIEETRQMVASGLTRDCELTVDYALDDDEVDADPTQMQQVLVNLLINAADAMKGKGRIELALSALVLPTDPDPPPPGASALGPGRYLVLRVRDHGPGIAAEHLDRVFEPFFTTKPKGRGTGLGLSVAQGIMARHQGAIGLVSGADGACFYLYLPASRRDEAIAPATSPGGPGEGRQLLFVDDDQSVRHAWSALLERKGWHVTRSRDGEEAWAQFSRTGKRWDVVLTDQSMPRLDGVGLAQRIHATRSPPPVVLMSGHVDEVSPEQLKTLFTAVLHKPVDAVELDRVLQSVVQGADQVTTPT